MSFKIFLFFLCALNISNADIIYLVGGEKLNGEIKSLEDDFFEIKLNADLVKINKNKIRSIVFENNSPQKYFTTPETTFKYWIEQIKKGDIDAIMPCYVSYLQENKKNELKTLPKNKFKDMIKEAKKSEFKIFEPLIIGDSATLKVERTCKSGFFWIKKEIKEEFYEFVLENQEWKLAQ
jgi:hypothetical protein